MDTTRFGNLKTPVFMRIICILALVLAGTTVNADNVPTHGANKHLDPLNTGNQIDKYAQVGVTARV